MCGNAYYYDRLYTCIHICIIIITGRGTRNNTAYFLLLYGGVVSDAHAQYSWSLGVGLLI